MVAILLLAGPAFGAYSYSRSLTIDHTKCGASDSANFTVLVYVSDPTLKTAVNGGHVQNGNGYDITFYSDAQHSSPLFWEMDTYDGVNGKVWAWVKLPAVSHTANTVFYVFYGDPTITTFQSTSTSAWDTTFKAVYHFGNGSTVSGRDSTINANDATAVNSPAAITGKISGAVSLESASSQYLTAGSANFPTSTTSLTFSAWVYMPATISSLSMIYFYGTEAFGKSLYPNIGSCGSNEFGMGYYGASTLSCTAALSTGAWHFIAGTYNGAAAIFQSYVDGIANGSPSNPLVSSLTNTYARIGAYSGGLYFNFPDLQAIAVDIRNRGVIGNADQHPSLEHALQLFTASLQGLGIRPDARDGRNLAIERAVILDHLVASLAHGCPDIRSEHKSIISLAPLITQNDGLTPEAFRRSNPYFRWSIVFPVGWRGPESA